MIYYHQEIRFSFVLSADVGGFFLNPDSELLVRWYQVSIFFLGCVTVGLTVFGWLFGCCFSSSYSTETA